ncbi:MAG: GFA family protein [Sphingopyxis sp.]|nr:GFA family protein [Sphingopyxis sp.]
MNKTIDDQISGHTTGGCLCGQVRYGFRGAPLLTAICHCRNCQRQSGSAFGIVAAVAAADFALQGDTRTFQDSSDSGRTVARVFCPECGSPILSTIEPMPGMVLIKAGTLDDPGSLQPAVEVYCDRALPFLPALAGTERHAGSNI